MSEDYELHPFTVEALQTFRDGNDPNRPGKYIDGKADELLDGIDGLTDFERGLVIIDLLTLCDAYSQAISIIQLNRIMEGNQ